VLEAFAGGTERHLLDLVRWVDDFDHVVVAPRSHLGESTDAAVARTRALGARVEVIDMRRSPSPVANTRALWALRALLARRRPAVVHGHSSVGGAFARLASIGSSRPLVYTPHGVKRSRWALAGERLMARRTDRFIAVSESEAEFALRHRLADTARLSVIPNGVDPEPPPALSPSLRSQLGIGVEAPLVGSLGRLTWQKAPEVFVAACALVAADLPDANFLLIGAGPDERRVSQDVQRAGIEKRFHRLPSLPGAAAAFAELDLYVLSSRFEGFPYTILEAMRAAVPVVATAADGTRDAVISEVTGLLTPIDDPRALATAMVGVLRDERRREELGAAGRRRVVEHFDVRAMAAATTEVYREVL
jgi:glycosyltransferase involved in cell wall biosynthesis